jgi:hypothetical protein
MATPSPWSVVAVIIIDGGVITPSEWSTTTVNLDPAIGVVVWDDVEEKWVRARFTYYDGSEWR